MVLVRCEIGPSLRISRKLKCIDKAFDLLSIDEINDVLNYARNLNLDSEVDVDRLLSYISSKYNITFTFN